MKQEIVYYKCIFRPTLWWIGNETSATHYLCQKKDCSFRVKGIGGIKPDMKYKFNEDEIEAIRAKHPEFDMLFKLKETKIYHFGGGE